MTTISETIDYGIFPVRLPARPTLIEPASIKNEPPTDYELTRRVATGDMDAFEQLYQTYHRRVYSLCLRMTTNVAEAEDLTQEVFVHFFRKAGSFQGRSSFMTWLHRMTVNQVLMHFRKPSVKRERATDESEMPTQAVRGTENPRQMPIIDRIALDRAVAQLSPGYRAVFTLHDMEGFEHEEIGRMLGISGGTSKSQLHKARKRLRQLLKRGN